MTKAPPIAAPWNLPHLKPPVSRAVLWKVETGRMWFELTKKRGSSFFFGDCDAVARVRPGTRRGADWPVRFGSAGRVADPRKEVKNNLRHVCTRHPEARQLDRFLTSRCKTWPPYSNSRTSGNAQMFTSLGACDGPREGRAVVPKPDASQAIAACTRLPWPGPRPPLPCAPGPVTSGPTETLS